MCFSLLWNFPVPIHSLLRFSVITNLSFLADFTGEIIGSKQYNQKWSNRQNCTVCPFETTVVFEKWHFSLFPVLIHKNLFANCLNWSGKKTYFFQRDKFTSYIFNSTLEQLNIFIHKLQKEWNWFRVIHSLLRLSGWINSCPPAPKLD